MTHNTIPNRNNWNFEYSFQNLLKDKDELFMSHIWYQFIRTQKMFEWRGLPNTIPQQDLERILQLNGNATWGIANDGKLYVYRGGLGGQLNQYRRPTISIVAVPYLNFNKTFKIGDDCVVMLNDDYYMGLITMFERYASLMTECDISLRFALFNSRIPMLISADSDSAKKDAEEILSQIERGRELGVVGTNTFYKGLQTLPYAHDTKINELLELNQYIKASWFNELGVEASYNMKREAINSAEVGTGIAALLPLTDNMLECRIRGAEEVNKMFGLNISVDFSSSWKNLREEERLSLEEIESEIKSKNKHNEEKEVGENQ